MLTVLVIFSDFVTGALELGISASIRCNWVFSKQSSQIKSNVKNFVFVLYDFNKQLFLTDQDYPWYDLITFIKNYSAGIDINGCPIARGK